MTLKIIYSHKLYNSWQKRKVQEQFKAKSIGECGRDLAYLQFYHVKKKHNPDDYLYISIDYHTFILVGLQETFIEGFGGWKH